MDFNEKNRSDIKEIDFIISDIKTGAYNLASEVYSEEIMDLYDDSKANLFSLAQMQAIRNLSTYRKEEFGEECFDDLIYKVAKHLDGISGERQAQIEELSEFTQKATTAIGLLILETHVKLSDNDLLKETYEKIKPLL